jgi:hypothetical protein
MNLKFEREVTDGALVRDSVGTPSIVATYVW